MGLGPGVFGGVRKAGYRQPTPVQRRVVPIALQCIFVNPTDSGRIRPEARRHPFRQFASGIVKIFEHA